MKNIIIFGAPGSGKGTYSDEIVTRYGMGHISTGDVLRAEIKNGTELGKTAKGYIDNGQLIPDTLMIKLMMRCLLARALFLMASPAPLHRLTLWKRCFRSAVTIWV